MFVPSAARAAPVCNGALPPGAVLCTQPTKASCYSVSLGDYRGYFVIYGLLPPTKFICPSSGNCSCEIPAMAAGNYRFVFSGFDNGVDLSVDNGGNLSLVKKTPPTFLDRHTRVSNNRIELRRGALRPVAFEINEFQAKWGLEDWFCAEFKTKTNTNQQFNLIPSVPYFATLAYMTPPSTCWLLTLEKHGRFSKPLPPYLKVVSTTRPTLRLVNNTVCK